MSWRDSARKRQGRRAPSKGAGRRRVSRARILGLLALAAAVALAVLAPVGQASSTSQEKAERQARHAEETSARQAEREARHAEEASARQAKREAHRRSLEEREADKRQAREAERLATLQTANANVQITCKKIVVEYHGFPAIEGATYSVRQRVVFKGGTAPQPIRVLPETFFEFQGTEAKTEFPIVAPMGAVTIELRGRFEGFQGHFSVHLRRYCAPAPSFQIEQLHSFSGAFTTAALEGKIGQTVSNETVVTDTGNTPLTFSNLQETGCDATPVGGSSGSVPPFEATSHISYVCTHTLDAADVAAGTFVSSATITGTPPEPGGEPVTRSSGSVVVTASGVVPPANGTTGSGSTSSTSSSTSSNSTNKGKSGVLASSVKIPSLHVPHQCVRSTFTAYVLSAGVKSIVFYMDGHKVRALTYRNAHKGTLSVRVNGAKLKAGSHKLSAKITMSATAATAATTATRSATVKRCKP